MIPFLARLRKYTFPQKTQKFILQSRYLFSSETWHGTWKSPHWKGKTSSKPIPSWELTYPLPRQFWRWFSFSKVGYVSSLGVILGLGVSYRVCSVPEPWTYPTNHIVSSRFFHSSIDASFVASRRPQKKQKKPWVFSILGFVVVVVVVSSVITRFQNKWTCPPLHMFVG